MPGVSWLLAAMVMELLPQAALAHTEPGVINPWQSYLPWLVLAAAFLGHLVLSRLLSRRKGG